MIEPDRDRISRPQMAPFRTLRKGADRDPVIGFHAVGLDRDRKFSVLPGYNCALLAVRRPLYCMV